MPVGQVGRAVHGLVHPPDGVREVGQPGQVLVPVGQITRGAPTGHGRPRSGLQHHPHRPPAPGQGDAREAGRHAIQAGIVGGDHDQAGRVLQHLLDDLTADGQVPHRHPVVPDQAEQVIGRPVSVHGGSQGGSLGEPGPVDRMGRPGQVPVAARHVSDYDKPGADRHT
jgi:hypothetical protein